MDPARAGQPVGEIDFLVIHPERDLLVIEVKGGGVECDPDENRWTSRGRDGTFHIHAQTSRPPLACNVFWTGWTDALFSAAVARGSATR